MSYRNIHANIKHLKLKILTVLVATVAGVTLVAIAPISAFGNHTLYVGHSAVGNGKSCSSPGYTSVQSAVNAANSGDTVYLCGAQFAEQVFVNKSITLTGDQGSGLTAVGATFSTNASDFPSNVTTQPQALLVTTGNNVTVNGLKVSGPINAGLGCGADEYGVLALDGSLNLTNDTVANIADANTSLYGCQFGVGIQVGRNVWNASATASLSNVTVTGYQKNGVTVDGPGSSATVQDSMIVGGGSGAPFGTTIAQNGIQISRGAKGSVTNSTIDGNAYSGSGEATAAGLLVYGGFGDPLTKNVTVQGNKFIDNDVAVNFANYNSDASGQAATPTKDVANNNWIFSARVTNTTGLDTSNDGLIGYQAGIEDVGNQDSACSNTIVGPGYTDEGTYDATTMVATPGPDHAVVRDIDAGYTFPTTDFDTCNYGFNYGGGHFSSGYFQQYDHNKFNHWSSH